MKTFVTLLAATAVVYNVNAQSLEEGKKMISYERFTSAEKVLSPLAEKSPEANYYYGLAQLGSGDIEKAEATFKKFTSDFYNQSGLARVYFEKGKTTEANDLLKVIVDKAKKKDWERYKVAADAINYTKGGDVKEAISWYKIAKERNANDANILVALGDALLKENTGTSNGEAVDNFEQAIKLNQVNSLAYARKGLIWLQARQYVQALEDYNKAKEADAQNPLTYRDLANVYYFNGKYDLAKQNIEEYLKLSDKSVNDQLKYGNILFLSKNYAEAETKYAELINQGLGSKYPSLYRGLAYTQFELKKNADALKNLNEYKSKATGADKFTAEDELYLAQINLALASEDAPNAAKYLTEANQLFEKAVVADTAEDKAKMYRMIAEGYKDVKAYGKSADWYLKLVKDYPESSPLDYFYGGYYAYFAKEFTKSMSGFKAMEAKYADEPLAYFWQGKVQAAQDLEAKSGIAVEEFKKYLNLELKGDKVRKAEDDVFAYQYLAVYYYNKGDKTNAVNYSNKILQVEPANAAAKQIKDFFAKK